MRLTREQVIAAIDTHSWKQVRFADGAVLGRAPDAGRDVLVLRDAGGAELARGGLDDVYPQVATRDAYCACCCGRGGRVAVEALADGLVVCAECLPTFRPFYRCRVCERPLPPAAASSARRNYSRGLCADPACARRDDVARGRLCCDKAEYTPCACHYSYTCPEHAPEGVHVGTHD